MKGLVAVAGLILAVFWLLFSNLVFGPDYSRSHGHAMAIFWTGLVGSLALTLACLITLSGRSQSLFVRAPAAAAALLGATWLVIAAH